MLHDFYKKIAALLDKASKLLNKRQREVQKNFVANEEKVLSDLEDTYRKALNDIRDRIWYLQLRIDDLQEQYEEASGDRRKEILASRKQSKVYQQNYQKALEDQLTTILEALQGDKFKVVDDYLHKVYEDGYLGAIYDLHGQGIPVVMPLDQNLITKAVQTDTKLSKPLYEAMGEDIPVLKKMIKSELSRGIASDLSWKTIADNLTMGMNSPYEKSKKIAERIIRTEGHRIQQAATMDVIHKAQEQGASIVKQWCSVLDGHTRPTHQMLDGQIRAVDEPFEVEGRTTMYPGAFGVPEEDINCRCCTLQRATWALDEDELKELQERATFFGLDKTKDLDDFKKNYLKISEYDLTETDRSRRGGLRANDNGSGEEKN